MILTTLMRDYHNFHYQRHKKSMLTFMVLMNFLFFTYVLSNLLFSTGYVPQLALTTVDVMVEHKQFCLSISPLKKTVYIVTHWVTYIGFPAQILICTAVIFLKSSEDIIQRVSKLDNILKVSIFQVPRYESVGSKKSSVSLSEKNENI